MNKLMSKVAVLTIMLASGSAFADGCDVFGNCQVPEPESLPLVLLALATVAVVGAISKSRRRK